MLGYTRVMATLAAICAAALVAPTPATWAATGDRPRAEVSREANPEGASGLSQMRWSISVRTIATSYGKRRSDLLYVGEPLVVDVSLGNRARSQANLPHTLGAVVAGGSWHLDKIVNGKATAAQTRVADAAPESKQARTTVVPPRTGVALPIRLSDIREPGKYRLAFKPPWGRVQKGTWDFEVARPTTPEETMDMHLHMALRQSWAGKQDAAERELRALLSMNPDSAVAYSELANIRALQQRFREAVDYMQKAVTLTETGADRFSNVTPYFRPEVAGIRRMELERLKRKAEQ